MKSAIIQVDATPFKQYYSKHYSMELGLKTKEEPPKVEDLKVRLRVAPASAVQWG